MRCLTLCFLFAALVAATSTQQVPSACDDPENDPWVRETRDRVLSFDGLAAYAIERGGSPSQCRGAVTAEFDGRAFGTVRLEFGGGMVFEVETYLPEMSAVTLGAEQGFTDPDEVRQVLQAYVSEIGLGVDWSNAQVTEKDGTTLHTYWDPEAGVNASASLVFSGTTLVAVRFSIAL